MKYPNKSSLSLIITLHSTVHNARKDYALPAGVKKLYGIIAVPNYYSTVHNARRDVVIPAEFKI